MEICRSRGANFVDVRESLLGQGNSKREEARRQSRMSRWENGGKEVRGKAEACMSGLSGLG